MTAIEPCHWRPTGDAHHAEESVRISQVVATSSTWPSVISSASALQSLGQRSTTPGFNELVRCVKRDLHA